MEPANRTVDPAEMEEVIEMYIGSGNKVQKASGRLMATGVVENVIDWFHAEINAEYSHLDRVDLITAFLSVQMMMLGTMLGAPNIPKDMQDDALQFAKKAHAILEETLLRPIIEASVLDKRGEAAYIGGGDDATTPTGETT